MSSNNLQGAVTNVSVHLSRFCANFPYILFRPGFATMCCRHGSNIFPLVHARARCNQFSFAESCIPHGILRRIHLNLHEGVQVMCENTSFSSGLIVHHRLFVVSRFVYCKMTYQMVTAFLNLTEAHVPVSEHSLRI